MVTIMYFVVTMTSNQVVTILGFTASYRGMGAMTVTYGGDIPILLSTTFVVAILLVATATTSSSSYSS